MRSFALLLKDELHHLLRTRVVVITLSLISPLLVVLALVGTEGEEMRALGFAIAMGSNMAGMVCGAMVCASLIGELQQGTPVLFAIRPLPRNYLLLARFLALVSALVVTMTLSMIVSAIIAAWRSPGASGIFGAACSGLMVTLANAMLSGSIGVLIGVTASSLLAGVLLFIFVGSNACNLVLLLMQKLPGWAGCSARSAEAAVLAGCVIVCWGLLAISAKVFARKPL